MTSSVQRIPDRVGTIEASHGSSRQLGGSDAAHDTNEAPGAWKRRTRDRQKQGEAGSLIRSCAL